jgi:hypothetical protein
MLLFRLGNKGMFCLMLAILAGAPLRTRGVVPTVTAEQLIQRAVARAQQTQAASARHAYTYTKATVTEQLDPAGRVREHKSKRYQVSFQNGHTRVKLLEVNGHPPTAADLKAQAQNELSFRQLLGGAKEAGPEHRDNFLTPELVSRFDFSLVGSEVVNGRTAYQVDFRPRSPEPPQHRLVDRVVDRLSGTLWIDAEEYEVARADVRLCSQVDLLGGVIGCLKNLAYTLTRTRVADGLWLNTIAVGDFQGRKLLESLRIKTKSQATDFRPLDQGQP